MPGSQDPSGSQESTTTPSTATILMGLSKPTPPVLTEPQEEEKPTSPTEIYLTDDLVKRILDSASIIKSTDSKPIDLIRKLILDGFSKERYESELEYKEEIDTTIKDMYSSEWGVEFTQEFLAKIQDNLTFLVQTASGRIAKEDNKPKFRSQPLPLPLPPSQTKPKLESKEESKPEKSNLLLLSNKQAREIDIEDLVKSFLPPELPSIILKLYELDGILLLQHHATSGNEPEKIHLRKLEIEVIAQVQQH